MTHDPSEKTLTSSRYFQKNGVWTASTLGVRPAPDVIHGLRRHARHTKYACTTTKCDTSRFKLPTNLTSSYQLNFTIESTTGAAGVTVGASPNREEYTDIFFNPSNNSIIVDRAHSSLIKEFTNSSHIGFFEPYQMNSNGSSKTEPITMSVFVDGSLVEVYVNDRFALTSRIYPSREDSTGIALFKGDDAEVRYSSFEIWDGLLNVWPNRPANSSSLLVWDTAAATGNYTWWTGN